jgi:hypothetical protein
LGVSRWKAGLLVGLAVVVVAAGIYAVKFFEFVSHAN